MELEFRNSRNEEISRQRNVAQKLVLQVNLQVPTMEELSDRIPTACCPAIAVKFKCRVAGQRPTAEDGQM